MLEKGKRLQKLQKVDRNFLLLRRDFWEKDGLRGCSRGNPEP